MAYPKDNVIGPLSVTKLPRYNTDGSVPEEGDIFYIDAQGNPQLGSAALVARSLVSLADLAAIQAQATISRTKVYFAQDTSKQYMWTGGGSTGAWEVAEVNAGLALGETSATAFRGDQGAELYANVDHLNAIEAATGATTALKLANLTSPATPIQQGVALLGASGGATKLTKMPDGATAVFVAQNFTVTTGWSPNAGDVSVSGGNLVFSSNGGYCIDTIANAAGKTLWLRVKRATAGNITVDVRVDGVYSPTTVIAALADQYVIITKLIPAGSVFDRIRIASTVGVVTTLNGAWIGDYSYLTGSLSEEAARIADQLGDTAGVGVAANGTITGNSGNLIQVGDTITIAGKTYTAIAYGEIPDTEGEFCIGDSSNGATLDNLGKAIKGEAASKGTLHFCTAHPLVTATYPGSGQILPVTAINTGELGNTITLSALAAAVSAGRITLSGSTLTGGYSDAAAKASNAVANASQGLTAKTSIVDADEMLILDSVTGKIKKRLTYANFKSTLLAANGNTDAGKAVQGNDSRLAKAPASWTPVPRFGGVPDDGTHSVVVNSVVTVGKMAYLEFAINWTAKGTKTGNFTIDGLPSFPSSGIYIMPATNVYAVDMTGLTAGNAIFFVVNQYFLEVRKLAATGTSAADALTDANFTNTSSIRGRFYYQIA